MTLQQKGYILAKYSNQRRNETNKSETFFFQVREIKTNSLNFFSSETRELSGKILIHPQYSNWECDDSFFADEFPFKKK